MNEELLMLNEQVVRVTTEVDGLVHTYQSAYRDLPAAYILSEHCRAVAGLARQVLARDGVPLRPGEQLSFTVIVAVENLC